MINFCVIPLICILSFIFGRIYKLRDFLIVDYKNNKMIYVNKLFPDCLETEYFIEMHKIVYEYDSKNQHIINHELLRKVIDERMKYNKERAINRAVHSEGNVSKKIWETLNRWDELK